ncbi:hypothetical protein Agabi119p4_1338 [Agaricus bisporus var. burnettii]|uniref:Uncharacterized protein n=1 Tax=Agaricus bisporus var. burnettii TaxID=192524 RepID=A0A8H7FC85_AGABI|nr:hypothetical protein Agabi119p4_1338 [Agaricus bisporus var. burnettii]
MIATVLSWKCKKTRLASLAAQPSEYLLSIGSLACRHTSTAWSIIICPNPRTDIGNVYNDRPGTYEFRLNLHSGIYLDRFLRDFPMCAGASNMTYHIPPKRMQSDLLRIFHKDLKNEKGKTVPEVLVDILKKFPKYDFEMKEGSEAAICDMEKKLVSIADIVSFEEVELGTKFGERVGRQ